MRSSFPALSLLAILAAAGPALAQAPADKPSPGDERSNDFVTIGLGAGYLPDYEGSDEMRLVPVPGAIGRVSGFNFLYLGNRISVDLLRDGDSNWDFQLGPTASVGFNRTSLKSIDDRRIRALGKVDRAIELGGYAGIGRWGVLTSPYDRLSATVTARHDVAGGHGGTLVTPSVSYMTPLSRTAMVAIAASANHADDDYARAYYTITPVQSAASGLPTYNARGGWKDWTLAAATNISLTGDLTHGLSLAGGVAYTRLVNDFGDSPVTSIAGSRDQWMAGMGLAYTF